jgi:Mce-associated membrane protein
MTAARRKEGAPGGRASYPLLAALALLLLAATSAGWFGWSWYRAEQAGPSPYAQTRDRVLQAGEQAVQNFSTLDYRRVSRGLSLWEQSSTGALHSQIAARSAQFEQQVQAARTITTAKILDGALTALNIRAGTARIIVAVQITVIPATGTPVVKQNRLEGQLTRTPSGWKLSALGQVPVGAAAASGRAGRGTGGVGGQSPPGTR